MARDSAHLCTRATPPIDLRHWLASEGKSAVRRAIRTSEGNNAIGAINGNDVDGRTLNVNEAKPKTEGASQGGGGGGRGRY